MIIAFMYMKYRMDYEPVNNNFWAIFSTSHQVSEEKVIAVSSTNVITLIFLILRLHESYIKIVNKVGAVNAK